MGLYKEKGWGMRRTPRVLLAGEEISERHICVFHRGVDELFEQLVPFIVQGFAAGDHAFNFVEDRGSHRKRLRALGVNLTAEEASGQLDIREWADRPGDGRPLSRAAMLEWVRHNLDAVRGLGYDRTR